MFQRTVWLCLELSSLPTSITSRINSYVLDNQDHPDCVTAAGVSAPAGEKEAAGGLRSAPEGAGAAGGALLLLRAREDPAGASTGGEQVGGEQHADIFLSRW